MALLLFGLLDAARAADELDYRPTDGGLEVVRLDSVERESLLAVHCDAAGRLFVGGREALFVYEPASGGGYGPRQELVRLPDHSWVYDIAVRGNDVYVLTVSALYVVDGAVTRREGLVARRLVWGVPLGHVHQCFHGMAIGPEGDIYFAMGDPLWYYGDFNRPDHWGHWTFFSQPEGTRTPYNGVGGVFRCRPDGSNFRVVARGLRNPCGLCFDRHWNLFSNDNDHESMPAEYVPGRLIHVTPRAYFNWPRGWLLSKMPDRADLLETMFDGMGRAVPVGQCYYDDTYLPESYRNNLLLARWGIRAVTRYPLQRRGASFRATEASLIEGRDLARPVHVAVGRGGRVFFTVAYMAQNEGSPVYRSDLVMLARGDDAGQHPFEGYEAVAAASERLFAELADPSWSRRYRAHVELLRRGGDLLDQATERLAAALAGGDHTAAEHLVWLAAASGSRRAAELTLASLGSPEANVRLQAVRALVEFADLGASRDTFVAALADTDAQVQHAALVALFDHDEPVAQAVLDAAARSDDTYLRQAATLLMAEKLSAEQLAGICRLRDARLRLAGTLAAGFKLTLPPAVGELSARLPLDKLRDDGAYQLHFADGRVDLRELGRVGNYTVADHWKAGQHSEQQQALFELLMEVLADGDERVRLQAAHFLSVLADPRSEPAVARVITATEERRLGVVRPSDVPRFWVCGPWPDGGKRFETQHPPEQGPIDLTVQYDGDPGPLEWREAGGRFLNFTLLLGSQDDVSYYAYCRLESAARQRVQLLVGSDDGVKVWLNGHVVHSNDVARGALPYQDVATVELQPGGNELLVRVHNRRGESGMYLSYRALSEVVPTLPEKVNVAGLAERLASAASDGAAIGPEFFEVDWAQAVTEGDAVNGRRLFEQIGCGKCHAATAEATVVGGPSLADAGRRFTVAQLVESILTPNRQISPVFRATLVVTDDGLQHAGLVVGETAERLELLLPDTKRVAIDKARIETRQLQDLSPMPQGIIKKPAELRDLLSFLLGGTS